MSRETLARTGTPAARALSQDVLGTIIGYLVKPGASAAEAAGALVVCSVVSKEWKRASDDSVARLLGSPWRALYLRASPLFRQRVLVARHAAGAYRESGMTAVWCGGRCYEGLKFACTTRRADEAGASFEMRDLSFVFELFELNSASLSRTEHVTRIWNRDIDEADEEGWERPPPPEEDFAAEARRRARGRPHFAARDDLGDDEENLVWTATARADPDGRVEAGHSYLTIPVDSGMDDYYSFWLNQFRLVVTVVRDTDAKMCQIVDVRGSKAGQQSSDGFYEIGNDGETGGAAFRVVDCDGDGDLDAHLYFCTERNDQAFVDEPPGELKKIRLDWSDADDAALRPGFPEVCQGNDADVATVASKLATLHWI